MTNGTAAKDLLVLTADSHMRSTVEALLRYRNVSLGISNITSDVIPNATRIATPAVERAQKHF